MKKIITFILLFAMIITFNGCGEDVENTSETEQNGQTTSTISVTATDASKPITTTTPPTPSPTPEKKLSSDCDKVLASGYDKDNNFYELVANEHEDYSGTTIEMGVIKNNKWLISLTNRTPFLGSEGLASGSIYSKLSQFEYIGAGCFYYRDDIWNVNNGKVYDYTGDYRPVVKHKKTCINNEGKIILECDGETFKLLDTNTMTISDTNFKSSFPHYNGQCYPYSEGLFAVMDYYEDYSTHGFYDAHGNKVIDLSMYKIKDIVYGINNSTYVSNLFFQNGKCTFIIENDQRNYYNITIDKTGKVVNSEKIER